MNPADQGGVPDILQMFINISGAFPAAFTLIQAIFTLVGLILFGQALIDIYAFGNPSNVQSRKQITASSLTWRFIVATVLTSLAVMVQITQNTLGGTSVNSGAMMYQAAGMSAAQKLAVEAVMGAFAIVGYIAFGRGWLLLDKHFNGANVGVGGPIWHIIGGTILVFMDSWLPRIGSWFGFDFVNILLF